ncbi:MAG TPA: hypothetical protein VFH61_09060, partial [Thermoleophilia bacterium]|nr:hypothetical protein [Thermoleophilia bacterium]
MSADALEVAIAAFDLAKWCEKAGFKAQGFKREEWLHDCPFCNAPEKLSVNAKTRKWRCFVCHHRFRLPDLVAAFEGSFHQAIAIILTGSQLRDGTLAFIPELAADAERAGRPDGWQPATLDPPPYFAYLTDHVAYTRGRGFDLEHLRLAGVGICAGGRYQDRLVFPARRYPDGAWVYFQTRATWEKAQQLAGDYRKNLNPVALDVSRSATPSDVLMGLDWVQARGLREVALVEGPTDWLGFGPGAVVSFGTKLSDWQIGELVRAGVQRVVMA